VCGPAHRELLTSALGGDGIERAERQSRTFLTSELPGVHEWRFDAHIAQRITQPVLLVQGGPARHGSTGSSPASPGCCPTRR
jgi:hypothetical protein